MVFINSFLTGYGNRFYADGNDCTIRDPINCASHCLLCIVSSTNELFCTQSFSFGIQCSPNSSTEKHKLTIYSPRNSGRKLSMGKWKQLYTQRKADDCIKRVHNIVGRRVVATPDYVYELLKFSFIGFYFPHDVMSF